MFESIKRFFWIEKQVDFHNINENSSAWQFYPLFNSPYQLKQLSRGDYINLYKSWSYAAITTVADSISDLEYHLLAAPKSSREVNHKYMKFINSEFLETVASFLKLNGECYYWKVQIWSTIDELIPLRPDLIQIEQDAGWEVTWYRYNMWSANYVFRRDQLIIFKNFSPYDTLGYEARWIWDVQAIAIQAETDNAVINWNWNFFRNNASAWDIIEAPDTIDADVKQRFSDAWNNKFRWVNNAHKLAILDWGMKFAQNSRSQKEMDFVEQRRFSRDEILGIFKVPKAIIGLWEWVNVWNVKAFEIIFAKRTIKPLAKQIQETLNKELFKWVWYFEFINIVPTDMEQLRADLDSWAITINEYRRAVWKLPLTEWNILKLNPFQVSDPVSYKQEKIKSQEFNRKNIIENDFMKWINIWSIIKREIRWTEEYEQKRWKKKIMRNDQYEYQYNKQLQKIFKIQEEDILNQIKDQKSIWKPKWNELKYLTLYHTLIWPLQKEVIQNEWDIAFNEINIDAVFQIWDPATSKWLKDNIDKFAKEIDRTTKDQIFEEIDKWNKEWLWAVEISRRVSSKFDILKKSRAESIVRTETIRASSYATQKAWEDSEVVEWKQRWTAIDERVCPNCGPMHWKEIKLKDDFFKKWQTAPGWLQLNYSDTPAAPLHPRCRCTLIPIIKTVDGIIDIEEKPVNPSKYSDQDLKNADKLVDLEDIWSKIRSQDMRRIVRNAEKLKLDDNELWSILNYTSNRFWEINWALRNPDWIDPKLKNKYTSYTKVVDYTLDKFKKVEWNTFRWMNLWSKEMVNQFIETITTKWYSDKTYISTTQRASMTMRFMDKDNLENSLLMVMKWKNGYNIAPVSIFEREKEVLFSRNSYFQVDKVINSWDLTKEELKEDFKWWTMPKWLKIIYMSEKSIKWINPYLYEDERFKKAFENWNNEYIKRYKI